MTGPAEWKIPCRDAVGRDAELRLSVVEGSRYGLTMPPGESATLDHAGLVELSRAARCLAGVALWHEEKP